MPHQSHTAGVLAQKRSGFGGILDLKKKMVSAMLAKQMRKKHQQTMRFLEVNFDFESAQNLTKGRVINSNHHNVIMEQKLGADSWPRQTQ